MHVRLIGDTYRVIDWAHITQYFTMDVLTDVAFSRPLGYLKNNVDMNDYIETVRAYMPVLEMQTNPTSLINTIPVLRIVFSSIFSAVSRPVLRIVFSDIFSAVSRLVDIT
jgi:hypothetical protein